MIGYRFFTTRLASAVKLGKLGLLLFSLILVSAEGVHAQIDQPGPSDLSNVFPRQEDSDGLNCFNTHLSNWQGVGFLTFSKSSESSGQSGYFGTKIRIRYASWGWDPLGAYSTNMGSGADKYGLIWSKTADLGSNQCTHLVGVRYCARFAGTAGTQLKDGTTLKKDQPGYDPGRCTCRPECKNGYHKTPTTPNVKDDPYASPCCSAEDYAVKGNTCCSKPTHPLILPSGQTAYENGQVVDCNDPAINKKQRENSCVSPLRFKTERVTRLCAYEDAWDLSDMDEKFSPFHHMDDVCGRYTDKKVRDACVESAVQNYAMMGALMGGAGGGLIIGGLAAAIGALIAVFTGGALNYDVMTTSVGESLGCVDVPLAPPPPTYFYNLQNAPPLPRVLKVSNNPADFVDELSKYPSLTVPLTDPKNPENWHYEKNVDWFYPKIGIELGNAEMELTDDGKELVNIPGQRDVRILTGDFYAEDTVMGTGTMKVPAGVGKIDPLPPLTQPDRNNSKAQLNSFQMSVDLPQDNGSSTKLTYDIATEVHDDDVCAYAIGRNIVDTRPGAINPSRQNPLLIGCVARPRSYYAMYDDLNGKFKKGDLFTIDNSDGQPYPQIFHPWYNPSELGYPDVLTAWGPSNDGSINASTYNEPKFYWWLTHDPRQAMTPVNTSGFDSYEEYKAEDSKENSKFSLDFSKQIVTGKTIPQLGCDSPDKPQKTPSNDHVPLWTTTWSGNIDYFKRGDLNRNHRIHGAVYCVDNYDKNKNGKIDIDDTDLCAQYPGSGQTMEMLAKLPKDYSTTGTKVDVIAKAAAVPSGYVGVSFTGRAKIPNPMPRKTATVEDAAKNVYTTFPGDIVAVDGDIHTVPGALDNQGNYKTGIRFYSADPALGCDKVLDSLTNEVINAPTCMKESVNGLPMYYRDPPDRLRGESIKRVNGKMMLVQPEYKNIVESNMKTVLAKGAYDKKDDHTVPGECPLSLLSDGLAFSPQMPPDGCCAATADACSDPSKWVDPSQRSYTIPDLLRGQNVRKSDQYEDGIERGYCVKSPPSGCPAQLINNSDGSQVLRWDATHANYSTEKDQIGKGIGTGACMPGYGGAKRTGENTFATNEGVYGEKPERKCEKGNTNYSTQGKWGDVTRPCLPIFCPAAISGFTKKRDGLVSYNFKCDWLPTRALTWAQPNDKEKICHALGGKTEWRVKYCGEDGQWKNYTCWGNKGWPADGYEDPGCTENIKDKWLEITPIKP